MPCGRLKSSIGLSKKFTASPGDRLRRSASMGGGGGAAGIAADPSFCAMNDSYSLSRPGRGVSAPYSTGEREAAAAAGGTGLAGAGAGPRMPCGRLKSSIGLS